MKVGIQTEKQRMGAALTVERIEGLKIRTTEYYGLMNLGGLFEMIVLLYKIEFVEHYVRDE